MSAKVLLVNGIPGTGKTTLARKLSNDLSYTLIAKDDLKEFFFDELSIEGIEQSQMIGRVTFESLYILIDQYLRAGQSVMVECPFYAKFARPVISKSLEESGGTILEVYCTSSGEVRRQRVESREVDGSRHSQHIAGDTTRGKTEEELLATYAPLELGKVIKVDTEHFGEAEYNALVTQVKFELGE